MQNPTTDIQEMIKELNRFQLPSSLMESLDTWREDAAGAACREFNSSQLSWFLDLLNRFRGPEDRKDSLLEVFDPGMYTANHPAWEAAPGTEIELPALTSEVAAIAGTEFGICGDCAGRNPGIFANSPNRSPMRRSSALRRLHAPRLPTSGS